MKLKMEYIAETSIGSTTIGDVGNIIAGGAGKSIVETTVLLLFLNETFSIPTVKALLAMLSKYWHGSNQLQHPGVPTIS